MIVIRLKSGVTKLGFAKLHSINVLDNLVDILGST